MNFKKNIILTSVGNNDKNTKGIFTIDKQSNTCTGILRIYNLNQKVGNFCLGIMVNGVPLQKIALGSEVVFCKVDLPISIDLNSKISVIVVSNDGVVSNPIVFGSTENATYQDNFNMFDLTDINKTIETEIKNQMPLFQQEEQFNENIINLNNSTSNKVCDENNCANCVYKKSFYEDDNTDANKNSLVEKTKIKEENTNRTFFEIISPKIEELFEQNAPCEELNALVASSKWVTVNIDEFEKYYIGVIYDNNNPKYIAYAVKGIYSETPPKELEPNSQWLPIDSLNIEGDGYWIMFQDALTGE